VGTALRRFVPGPIFYAITILVLGMLVVASQPDLSGMSGTAVVVGLTAGAGIALVWGICFALEMQATQLRMPTRTWASWLGVPVVALLALALSWSNLPMTARFEMSRSSLEEAAARAEAGATVGPGWIGLVHVEGVAVTDGTTVFVLYGDGIGLEGCGLAYAHGRDPGMNSWESQPWLVVDYGHGWWYECNYFVNSM
jgi:hypothetical protein